jgi:hypothetical protein
MTKQKELYHHRQDWHSKRAKEPSTTPAFAGTVGQESPVKGFTWYQQAQVWLACVHVGDLFGGETGCTLNSPSSFLVVTHLTAKRQGCGLSMESECSPVDRAKLCLLITSENIAD